jgi:5-methylcytosine-specific restriction endonuclease McrA
MVHSGRAEAVETYDYGPCPSHFYPSVIVLKKYIRKKRIVLSPTRKNIYWRDKYICQYCSKKFPHSYLTLDHIIPKASGGLGGWLNLVTACISCNQKKGCKSISEAGMELIKEPTKPHVNILNFYHLNDIPEQWENYISYQRREK